MRIQLTFVFGCALVLAAANLAAQTTNTWQTVDDFIYEDWIASNPFGICMDGAGNIYVAGCGGTRADGSLVIHALVRKSSDGGATWATVDDFVYPGSFRNWCVGGIASDPAGNLYATIQVSFQDGKQSGIWVVRQSADRGLTWSTVDDFQAGLAGGPLAITADTSGNVYVAGQMYDGSVRHWIVRKSSDAGKSWTNVDDFIYKGVSTGAMTVFGNSSGIFVGGFGNVGPLAASHWLTRKSTDAGATWTLVDDYQDSQYKSGQLNSLGSDAAGNLYAAGYVSGTDVDGSSIKVVWVRKSSDGGNTWTTLDAIHADIPNEPDSQAVQVATDGHGTIYVAGYSLGSSGAAHLLVWQSTDAGVNWALTATPLQPGGDGGAAIPRAFLCDGAGHLYTVLSVGAYSHWVVLKGSLPPPAPPLRIQRVGQQVALSWPATSAGFSLEAADFLSPAPNWSAVGDAPVVIGDQNVVTVGMTNNMKFYRLRNL